MLAAYTTRKLPSASLRRSCVNKRLASRATQRAVWLEEKVLPREATIFPGQGLLQETHTPEREKASWVLAPAPVGKPEQTRSCAPDQDEADGPIPDADSRSIET